MFRPFLAVSPGLRQNLLCFFWKLYASRHEKAAHAVTAGPAVDTGKIVTNRIKWIERYPSPLRPSLEEFVNHHLPSSGMQARRVGQDTFKIKDRSIELMVLIVTVELMTSNRGIRAEITLIH